MKQVKLSSRQNFGKLLFSQENLSCLQRLYLCSGKSGLVDFIGSSRPDQFCVRYLGSVLWDEWQSEYVRIHGRENSDQSERRAFTRSLLSNESLLRDLFSTGKSSVLTAFQADTLSQVCQYFTRTGKSAIYQELLRTLPPDEDILTTEILSYDTPESFTTFLSKFSSSSELSRYLNNRKLPAYFKSLGNFYYQVYSDWAKSLQRSAQKSALKSKSSNFNTLIKSSLPDNFLSLSVNYLSSSTGYSVNTLLGWLRRNGYFVRNGVVYDSKVRTGFTSEQVQESYNLVYDRLDWWPAVDYLKVSNPTAIRFILRRFGYDVDLLQRRLKALRPRLSKVSRVETFLYNSLVERGISVVPNSNLIHPYEVDLFLPDYDIAIEYNGMYWHGVDSPNPKPADYHFNKSNLCSELGVSLYHFWDYSSPTLILDFILSLVTTKKPYLGQELTYSSVLKHRFYDLVRHHVGDCLVFSAVAGTSVVASLFYRKSSKLEVLAYFDDFGDSCFDLLLSKVNRDNLLVEYRLPRDVYPIVPSFVPVPLNTCESTHPFYYVRGSKSGFQLRMIPQGCTIPRGVNVLTLYSAGELRS